MSTLGKIGGIEKLTAFLRGAPAQEPGPKPSRRPLRLADNVLAPLGRTVSFMGRLLLFLGGRTGELKANEIGSIVFIRLDDLGDVIHATPVLRALKAWNPGARLTVFARSRCAELLLRLPFVDEVEYAEAPWIGRDSSIWRNLTSCLNLARRLRERSFDMAIDLRYHNRLDSLLLSLCGARRRLGFDAGGMGFWLTHRAPWPSEEHEAEREAGALRRFGIPVSDLKPVFPMSALEARERATLPGPGRRLRGKRAGPLIAIHVGSGNRIKRWMPERFAWLGRELALGEEARVAVLAGPGEEPAGELLVRALPAGRALDMRGKLGIMDLAAVISQADLFIGNDAGPAHIAAALGTPTLVIFGGTSLARQWAPRGEHVRVLEKWVACKPCHSTTCPFDQACLRKVTVDEALSEVRSIISRKGGPSRCERSGDLGGILVGGG